MLCGDWMVSFLNDWLFIAPPAIQFLVAWGLEKRRNREGYSVWKAIPIGD
jgi:hypothetical protein